MVASGQWGMVRATTPYSLHHIVVFYKGTSAPPELSFQPHENDWRCGACRRTNSGNRSIRRLHSARKIGTVTASLQRFVTAARLCCRSGSFRTASMRLPRSSSTRRASPCCRRTRALRSGCHHRTPNPRPDRCQRRRAEAGPRTVRPARYVAQILVRRAPVRSALVNHVARS